MHKIVAKMRKNFFRNFNFKISQKNILEKQKQNSPLNSVLFF
jgi:hypothetical protein